MQQSPKKSKIAFVIPWFGKDVPGGAENATKSLIEHLLPYFEIEVLTTCVKDFHSNWNENFWKEGEYTELGVKIRRFKVRQRDTLKFDLINEKLMRGERVSAEDEKVFIEECIRSEGLNDYIAAHRNDYKWFIMIPYMFGTTYDGVFAAGEKAVLISCLHDESYAYMDIYKRMFEKVKKVLFLTMTEKRLAERLFPDESGKFSFAGLGLDFAIDDESGGTSEFKKKYGLGDFVLYAGRKDSTKNTPQLVEFFDRFVRETGSELQLVLIGPGEIPLPANAHIVDLGFLSKEEKYAAMGEARFLCNPSLNESFSIVLMESWICGKPVLVNGNCAVTKDHVLFGNGGLYYDDYCTFALCVEYFLDHRQEADIMAKSGKEYVFKNFTWERVAQNYLKILNV